MCGRYTLTSPLDEVVEVFEVGHLAFGDWVPRFNVAPTQIVPVLLQSGEGERRLGPMRWGLVPPWARDPKIGSRMINARSETAWRKPAFREAARHRRCVVPMDGFYEWRAAAGPDAGRPLKTPFWIHRPDRRVFGVAGLWERWRDPASAAEPLVTFTILTTDASEWMRPLHDRMPVLLDSMGASTWLDVGRDEGEVIEMLDAAEHAKLEAWEVSRAVNRPVNDAPELVEPLPGGDAIPPG